MEDAVSRARDIANRLSIISAGATGGKAYDSDLGKRSRDDSQPYRPPPMSGSLYGFTPMPSQYNPGTSILPSESQVLQELRVPNSVVGAIIGKGGENLARLQRETGAGMTVMRESDMKPGETTRLITLRGAPENCRVLQDRLEKLIAERMASATTGSFSNETNTKKFTTHMPVPNARVGAIIGRQGIIMKQIQERTNTTLKIPSGPDAANPDIRTITISADSEGCILAAQAEISLVVAQGPAGASAPPSSGGAGQVKHVVPDDKVGAIIGKGGSTLKELQARLGVKIQIPQAADVNSIPPVRTLTLSGPADAVYQAITEIEDKVNFGAGARTASSGVYPATSASQRSYYQQPVEAVQQDTSYYADFWNYASYYGERAARLYYKTWSPPIGTPPPAGVIVAKDMTPEELAAAAAKATGGAASNSLYASSATTATASAATAVVDEESEEWKTYAKTYRQWWLDHGKAAGAPEKPPAM